MAEFKKATQKTGMTHFPLEEEKNNQKRVPPRGKTKEQMKTASQTRDKREASSATDEERTISRAGAKGGKSSGSRAGLVSSSKKTRRT
ncbi:MAG TPA: hypothetical protein VJV04_03945 [Nitrospiraceae bacterium]|nr:hypothetical protein [Nitrospiraceae bacterium]